MDTPALPALEQQSGESFDQHRAVLLYAMMEGELRSYRSCAKAFGCSDAKMRQWCQRWSWHDRIRAVPSEPASVQQHAVDMFTHLYPNHLQMMAFIRQRMPKEFKDELPDAPYVMPAPPAARKPTPPEHVPGRKLGSVAGDPQIKRDKVRETNDRIELLANSMLSKLSEQLADKTTKVAPHHINQLLKLRKFLADNRAPDVSQSSGGPAAEIPHRIRQAMETGDQRAVLRAIREDAMETVLICDMLDSQADVVDDELPLDDEPAQQLAAQS